MCEESVDEGTDTDMEDCLSADTRVELRRSRELGRRHLETYNTDLYQSEQDCIRESMRQRVRDSESGTSPEMLFKSMYGIIEQHGGAVVFTTLEDRVVPVASNRETMPWIGLDEEERVSIGEMDRGELVEEIGDELENLSREEFVAILEDAGRDWLLRLVAALRENE